MPASRSLSSRIFSADVSFAGRERNYVYTRRIRSDRRDRITSIKVRYSRRCRVSRKFSRTNSRPASPISFMRVLMMDVPEVWTLDGGELGDDRYWIRFLDADDRCIVVFEFDGKFDILAEMRVDSMAWEGDSFFTSRTR